MKTLHVVLGFEGGKKLSYQIKNPKDDLTQATVKGIFEDMIAKQAIIVNGAYPNEVKDLFIRELSDTRLS